MPWELDAAAKKLSDDVIDSYAGMLSNPDSLHESFGWYRALDATLAQPYRDAATKARKPAGASAPVA